jgi:hypothetical protein
MKFIFFEFPTLMHRLFKFCKNHSIFTRSLCLQWAGQGKSGFMELRLCRAFEISGGTTSYFPLLSSAPVRLKQKTLPRTILD